MISNVTNVWIWLGFSLFLVIALSLDTFLLGPKHARPHESIRASLTWTTIWVVCALIFNGLLWLYLFYTATPYIAHQKALEFLTGYIIEKSLSVDNLFAFYMIFSQFRIPLVYQQRVLTIGIWSAIILRLLLILFGVWLVTNFHWVLYIMGAFLLLTGIKICFAKEEEKDLADTAIFKLLKRFFRLTSKIHSHHFFIRIDRLLYATPLFVALVFVEISDLVFAFDSIPAIFAITTDPFIVWSSNIFAILGLRALYFLLAGMVHKFHMLKYGVALLLIFVGTKMLIEPWIHISVLLSLSVILGVLVFFTGLSIWQIKRQGR
ncbi:TerC/Alx family metal homeostasis membrane protein [Aquicella lusitana]|uniref:TerC family integral membrane protein n=1 Tax=Aquicella lusitana TaxID=254246 RepID=A0A370GCF7_9COXI|nr:TerC/Alx family metal homeostasis membrane protein [Aquicella lusitana]RDI41512.1 TerC family integral membrane protein [Aquicella lusitana]VVC72594.1 Inner membrane protein alx [Aquicella lusitana]